MPHFQVSVQYIGIVPGNAMISGYSVATDVETWGVVEVVVVVVVEEEGDEEGKEDEEDEEEESTESPVLPSAVAAVF